MKRHVISVVFCLATGVVCAGTWETSSFRTANGQLVRIGMTKNEVRRDAGAPQGKNDAARNKNSDSPTGKRRGEVWT
ncbi:MAG TPA: hypothetical protein VJS66_05445, partial [Burkholderiales bacterium]|nr:hypothetical protein [Burkholderiales bacterium]